MQIAPHAETSLVLIEFKGETNLLLRLTLPPAAERQLGTQPLVHVLRNVESDGRITNSFVYSHVMQTTVLASPCSFQATTRKSFRTGKNVPSLCGSGLPDMQPVTSSSTTPCGSPHPAATIASALLRVRGIKISVRQAAGH